MTDIAIRRGDFHKLGATWDGQGVNFAVFAQHATAAELCLFDAEGRETRHAIPWRTEHVWHAYVSGAGPGQRYGWRMNGPFAPRQGHRYNPYKLLADPYAREFDGVVDLGGPVYAYPHDRGLDDLAHDERDDAAAMLKSVVIDPAFDWGDDRAPEVPWANTVVYELHVKNFTRLHPAVPEELRGTYAGLGSDAAISHLESLGVTAVELLPIHEHLDEPGVAARGMKNTWGYSTLGFFAPDRRYASRGGGGGDVVREFKAMVRALHDAGIEVILDVVYNHSCEGGRLGPTVCFRGLDNRVYYRLDAKNAREYVDTTGCGNTLDTSHPQVIQLVIDSLRYWAIEMRVDGFRFDLAVSLARSAGGDFDARSPLLAAIHQDPVLCRKKLIAEPWDLGDSGYRVGGFPVRWAEWNGRYRDTLRDFWRGERRVLGELGYRLTGSSDLIALSGRRPQASVNFITAHDGFTLRDLVSYEGKHNEANGEANKDGTDDNRSQNCGVEGETSDEEVLARRRRVARSLLASLLLSQGVPMITMGDELWRTQGGNNNAYCQDSELVWVDWRIDPERKQMLEACRALLSLRHRHPVFRREEFLRGTQRNGSRGKDITWLRPEGTEMNAEDWADPEHAAIGFRLDGDGVVPDHVVEGAATHRDDSFLVLMNGETSGALTFVLPGLRLGDAWRVVVDTRDPAKLGEVLQAGDATELPGGALVVLVGVRDSDDSAESNGAVSAETSPKQTLG
jgi:glycogen operon protein